MSEFDRQAKIFAEKVKNPDITIKAYSRMIARGKGSKNKNKDVYWFLTGEDTLVMVDCRDEEEVKPDESD